MASEMGFHTVNSTRPYPQNLKTGPYCIHCINVGWDGIQCFLSIESSDLSCQNLEQ